MTPDERIAELEAENARLREQIDGVAGACAGTGSAAGQRGQRQPQQRQAAVERRLGRKRPTQPAAAERQEARWAIGPSR